MVTPVSFLGKQVSFKTINNEVMVNVTEFAKLFPKKNLSKIINSKEIRNYMVALSEITNVISADLLVVKKGGDQQGTWVHKLLAIRIAQKLSPEFAIWVDLTIEKIMQQKTEEYKKKLEEQQPKLELYDALFESKSLLNLSEAAKLIGEGRNNLCDLLRKRGVFIKGTTPHQHYINVGIFKVKQYTYTTPDSELAIGLQTFVTQQGVAFLKRIVDNKKAKGKIYPGRISNKINH